MKKILLYAALFLAVPSAGVGVGYLLFGRDREESRVVLPAEVRGGVNEFIVVTATTDCDKLEWFGCEPSLQVFPPQLLKDTKSAIVCGPRGRYRLFAYGAKGNTPTKRGECLVVIGDAPPGPNPPGPQPPGPTPPTPPTPPQPPAPIPADGFRVLMIVETAEMGKLPAAQQAALYSATVRKYLNDHCVMGPDGKTPERRMWDYDTDVSGESKVWQDAMARKPEKSKLPWIIVSNGKTGYEGPLPANADAFLELLKKYAEAK